MKQTWRGGSPPPLPGRPQVYRKVIKNDTSEPDQAHFQDGDIRQETDRSMRAGCEKDDEKHGKEPRGATFYGQVGWAGGAG